MATSAEDYLHSLRQKFVAAAEAVGEHTRAAQAAYADYCNRGTRQKSFGVDDTVLVLEPDSTNTLLKKWKGPARVVRRTRPNRYTVSLDDGSQRHVHANKLRPFVQRVGTVGVIFEEDHEFGDVPEIPTEAVSKTVSRFGVSLEGSPLSAERRQQLENVLIGCSAISSTRIGKCHTGVHTIKLVPNRKLRQSYPYKVSMAYRGEVDRQIQELLEAELIYPVESSFSHPIVCVAKKDGGMRLCVDYLQLNALTCPDAFPMTNVTETLLEVAKAEYISTLDMLRGYWQIPIDPESQVYTAFVTHGGQYAWRVMPYGLRNSSSTFQRLINSVIAPHRAYACAYIDDVAVFSNSWDDHLIHVAEVLSSISEAGFTVNIEKCRFRTAEREIFGARGGFRKTLARPGEG